MQPSRLPPLKKPGSPGRASGFEDGPLTVATVESVGGFVCGFTPAALRQLVDAVKSSLVEELVGAVKGGLVEELRELRATFPAEAAGAACGNTPPEDARAAAECGPKRPALGRSKTQARLQSHQRSASFDDILRAPQDPNQHSWGEQRSEPAESRRREWLSGPSAALSRSRTFHRQGSLKDVVVSRKERTVSCLKSQMADQLLRSHALLPSCGTSFSTDKEEDGGASPGPGALPNRASPSSGSSGGRSLTGSHFDVAEAAIASGGGCSKSSARFQSVGAEAAPSDGLQDPRGQTEIDRSSARCEPLDITASTNTIKHLISTLDPRSVANLNQVEELRQQRVSELTDQMQRESVYSSTRSHMADADSDGAGSLQGYGVSNRTLQCRATLVLPGRWLLLVFGVLPLRHFLTGPMRHGRWGVLAGCYQPLVCVIVALACVEVAACSLELDVSRSSQEAFDGMQLGPLSDLALAGVSMVGLLLLGAPFGSQTLCECFPLLFLTGDEVSHMRLTKRMYRELVGLIVVWLMALLSRLYGSFPLSDEEQRSWSVLNFASFLVTSGVLISLALAMLSVCHSLAIMIDRFCVNVSDISTPNGDLTVAVREWNVMQAVLRKASKSIEHCFFALQTGAFAAVILVFFDVTQGLAIKVIPGALVFLGLTRIFYCAAAITDKCSDVPSLINSLQLGGDLDPRRQYVVQYIMQSAAGFRVLGVALNSQVTLKLAYFCGVVTVGLMHRVLSTGW